MDSAEVGVLTIGAALIGFVIWFFFGARKDEMRKDETKNDEIKNDEVIYA